MGVVPDDPAYPSGYLNTYLLGDSQATSESQRLALERYLRTLKHLQAAGLGLDEPGSRLFVGRLRDCLTARHDALAAGIRTVEQLLDSHQRSESEMDLAALDQALGKWRFDG
jgi:hypothetical protein